MTKVKMSGYMTDQGEIASNSSNSCDGDDDDSCSLAAASSRCFTSKNIFKNLNNGGGTNRRGAGSMRQILECAKSDFE